MGAAKAEPVPTTAVSAFPARKHVAVIASAIKLIRFTRMCTVLSLEWSGWSPREPKGSFDAVQGEVEDVVVAQHVRFRWLPVLAHKGAGDKEWHARPCLLTTKQTCG